MALYQPDIAQNVGTTLRTGACFGVPVHIIHPCGFAFSGKALRRSGMDYLDHVSVIEHDDWDAFAGWVRAGGRRLVLLSARGGVAHVDFAFAPGDIVLLGRESAGVPATVHEAVDARLRIPLRPGMRSLNVAVAGAMVLGEALRQTSGFPLIEG
ncbi:tRNA (cytidine/uridine-2'-O-)-methyltransferase [Rhodothalassium salexigens DSM 2132]|nr:tRNA (cytidine(34)-2'-O)-methyltransferase [Rhodothalassium salexigens]MBB4210447.1 tRNA (cytidine/uridine-2'-O-)-methyltransferase [Rhodothalassium salexigens DSM 2132]